MRLLGINQKAGVITRERSGIGPAGLWRMAWCFSLSWIVLTGCAVGPNYKRPTVNAPPNFRGAAALNTNSLAELPWWRMFRDETLQGLIHTALTNNYDLAIAVTRVEQARAIVAQNRAAFFPVFYYQAEVGRGKNAISTGPFFNNGQMVNIIQVTGNVTWEIDLWGRIRRLNESARAQFLASEDARRGVTVSLISSVAQAYFELLALDQELEIAHRASNSFAGSLRIFSERLKAGVASNLETSRAEAALDSAAASVPDLERRIMIQENQINVLLGRNPGPVPRKRALLEELPPPEVPAGLPSALLERRPDIRQAEQVLRSANAQIGVAKADFFPRISLTALLGQVSPELSVITSGTGNAWSMTANLVGPLFQWGRLRGQYRQVKAAWEEARLRYQATVLNAFQEVSNALIARQKLASARALQARSVKAYELSVTVSTQRYLVGNASYFEILEAQQQLFPAENTLVETELSQLLAVVQLYRALGGGWSAQEQIPMPRLQGAAAR